MKKILFCTSTLKTGRGGIASYAQDFIRTFKNDYDFTVITGDDGEVEDSNIKVIRISSKDRSDKNIKLLLDVIVAEKPDIVINSAYSPLSIATPYVPDDVKIITISHFTDDDVAKRAGLNGNYVDTMVSLSTFAKSFLERYSKVRDKDKVKVVYNFMPQKEKTEIDEKRQAKVLNIVYPGGSTYQKSADVVCKAILKLLKTNLDFNLYWIGDVNIVGGNLPMSRTKSLHDVLPNDSRIKQLGSVPRETAQLILAKTNVFLLPSRGEGFPISLIEAMRGCCIPIISDAPHGALDLIKNGKNGFIVKQGSAKDLYNCLVSIIKNHKNLEGIYQESYNTFLSYLTECQWRIKMKEIIETNNNHQTRLSIDNNKSLLKWGKAKMKTAELIIMIQDRLYRQPSMMIKFRYYKYFFKHLLK